MPVASLTTLAAQALSYDPSLNIFSAFRTFLAYRDDGLYPSEVAQAFIDKFLHLLLQREVCAHNRRYPRRFVYGIRPRDGTG